MATMATIGLWQHHMLTTSSFPFLYWLARWRQRKLQYHVRVHGIAPWRWLILSRCTMATTTTKPRLWQQHCCQRAPHLFDGDDKQWDIISHAGARYHHIALHDGDDLSYRVATTTTTTTAMMTTNVNNKASGASAWHFHIASRSGNDDNNSYWQHQTTSVRQQGLVRERTTCGVAWERRWATVAMTAAMTRTQMSTNRPCALRQT
jgi:hypothetical protein